MILDQEGMRPAPLRFTSIDGIIHFTHQDALECASVNIGHSSGVT